MNIFNKKINIFENLKKPNKILQQKQIKIQNKNKKTKK